LLQQAYSPMALRFFILQTHYRSTLDFSNDALIAAEKGMQRLLAAQETLNNLAYKEDTAQQSEQENNDVLQLIDSCTLYINDDFNTAMVMGSLFELASKIFSWRHEQLNISSIKKETFSLLLKTFNDFVTDIFGLKKE